MNDLSQKVAIVGVAESDLGYVPDKTALQLQAQAAERALDDAGLGKNDIDGLFCANRSEIEGCLMGEYLGIRPGYFETTNSGGSSFESFVGHAACAIRAGLCHTALICYGSTALSNRKNNSPPTMSILPQDPQSQFEDPYGGWLIAAYALAAQRHMFQYGTTSEQLAEIAVSTRKWASLNPVAQMRDPLNIQDVLNSTIISTPLHQRDCCLVNDGGGAIILTSLERARNLNKTPVLILGFGEHYAHRGISNMPDLTTTAAKVSGEQALRRAGLTVKDIDVLELYDSFTITVLLQLEDLGFCAKGEGGSFVEGQRLAPGGLLPANTSGGGLSYLHTGMFGIFLLIEAARQLRRECGPRQVPDASIALCNGIGGMLASSATVILGRE